MILTMSQSPTLKEVYTVPWGLVICDLRQTLTAHLIQLLTYKHGVTS